MLVHRMAAIIAAMNAIAYGQIVTDSVADFSGVQGHKGWEYGYVNAADGLGFRHFPYFGLTDVIPDPQLELGWYISDVPPPYTKLSAWGGHPGGYGDPIQEEQWTVRRWTAPFTSDFEVSGLLGDYAPDFGGGGDGVLAQAWGPHGLIWSYSTSQRTVEFEYRFSMYLEAGEFVDFIVKPKAEQDTDSYIWTHTIVPAPATLGVLTLAPVFMRGLRRRNKQARMD